MVGVPTPKPKYKTYKRGEAGTLSGTGGGTPLASSSFGVERSTQTSSYPEVQRLTTPVPTQTTSGGSSQTASTLFAGSTSSAGSYFKTTGNRTGYASASVSRITQERRSPITGQKQTSVVYKKDRVNAVPVGSNIKPQRADTRGMVEISSAVAEKIRQGQDRSVYEAFTYQPKSFRNDYRYFAKPSSVLFQESFRRAAVKEVYNPRERGFSYDPNAGYVFSGAGASNFVDRTRASIVGAFKNYRALQEKKTKTPGAKALLGAEDFVIEVGQITQKTGSYLFGVSKPQDRAKMLSDPQVQTGLVGVGIGITSVVFPVVGALAGGYFFLSSGYKTIESGFKGDFYSTGYYGGQTFLSVKPGLDLAKSGYTIFRSGFKFEPIENVVAPEVLSGATKYPKASSTEQIVQRFEATASGDKYIYAYSGTDPKSALSISKQGFNPKSFFSVNYETAVDYATLMGKGFVFKVKLLRSELEAGRLVGAEYWTGKNIPFNIKYNKVEIQNRVGTKSIIVESAFNVKNKLISKVNENLGQTSFKLEEGEFFKGVSASWNIIKGGVSQLGGRAAKGLEDPGIYITSKGRGSSAFTGINTNQPYTLSFNPFRGLRDFPSFTTFKAKGIKSPSEVALKTPGFEVVAAEQRASSSAGESVFFTTKRGMIGQGEVPSKLYWNPKLKKVMFEGGTKEEQLVVPLDSQFESFSVLGSKPTSFTFLGGRAVPLYETEVFGAGTKIKGYTSTGEYLDPKAISSRAAYRTPTYAFYQYAGTTSESYDLSRTTLVYSGRDYSSLVSSPEVYRFGGSSRTPVPSGIVPSYAPGRRTPTYTPPVYTPPIRTPTYTPPVYTPPVRTPGYTPPTRTPRYPPTTRTPPIKITPEFGSKPGSQDLFRVSYKTKGLFKTIGTGLTLGKAFELGRRKVETTASAQFKIIPLSRGGSESLSGLLSTPKKGFYTSKRGTFIERSSGRISTPGEVFEIPLKGSFRQRKTRGFKI